MARKRNREMDLFGDIFEGGIDWEEESKKIFDVLQKQFPGIDFFLLQNNGGIFSQGREEDLSIDDRKSLADRVKKEKGLIYSEVSDGRIFYALPHKGLDGTIIFTFPKGEYVYDSAKYGAVAVQISLEMYSLKKTLHDAQEILEEKNKQKSRQVRVMEDKYQAILLENNKAFSQLEEYSNLRQKILDTAVTAIYITDMEHRITEVNNEFCSITGFSKEYSIGKEFSTLLEASCLMDTRSDESGLEKIKQRESLTILTKDGEERIIIINFACIYDNSDKFTHGVGSFIDVTNLINAREDAMFANKAKRDFLATMSHEMRTPLNGIVGMAELFGDTHLDSNQNDLLNTIKSESLVLLSLINDVLDFSKIEAQKIEIESISFNMRTLIEEVGMNFSVIADQKGIELISYMSPDISPHLIGDPQRLRQILTNLIGNALKFTHEGEVVVSVKLKEETNENVTLLFSVKDTGIGISEEKRGKIFEEFTQVDSSTTRKFGGTGLGTSISKRLVELMYGEIGVESDHGKGSTFWFLLDYKKGTGEDTVLPGTEVDFKNMMVMVVDDNKVNRFILKEYLKFWGCQSVEAVDGNEALAILKDALTSKGSFDLILSDFQMPNMDGFELAGKIRAIERLKDIPIMILSSMGRPGDGTLSKELGIQGYLTKPIRRDELYRGIQSVMGYHTEDRKHPSTLVTKHLIHEETRKNIQILAVDDYPTNQKVVERYLTAAGYQVDLADNGQQAVAAYKRKQYDLILMDISMPVMDGHAATAKIREHESAFAPTTSQSQPRIPIIAMTAHAVVGDKDKSLVKGMDDYISKPMSRKGLLAMVSKWSMKSMEKEGVVGGSPEQDPVMEKAKGPQNTGGIPIDLEKVLEEYDGDRGFMEEVLNGFLDNAIEQVTIIRQALTDGDAEIVRKESHAIKGGSGLLTAKDLSGVALELENMGKSGSLEGGNELLERLERELNRLKIFAESIEVKSNG